MSTRQYVEDGVTLEEFIEEAHLNGSCSVHTEELVRDNAVEFGEHGYCRTHDTHFLMRSVTIVDWGDMDV